MQERHTIHGTKYRVLTRLRCASIPQALTVVSKGLRGPAVKEKASHVSVLAPRYVNELRARRLEATQGRASKPWRLGDGHTCLSCKRRPLLSFGPDRMSTTKVSYRNQEHKDSRLASRRYPPRTYEKELGSEHQVLNGTASSAKETGFLLLSALGRR